MGMKRTSTGIPIDIERIKEIIIEVLELSDSEAERFTENHFENRIFALATALSKTGMASAIFANILKKYKILEPDKNSLLDNFSYFNRRSEWFAEKYSIIIYKLNKEHNFIK